MTLKADSILWLRSALGRVLRDPPWVAGRDPSVGLRAGGSRPPRGLQPKEQAVDWSAIGEAARRHNLEPLLFDLVERGALSVPADIKQAWEGQYYRNQIFNLALLEKTGELLETAARSGIRPVVLKGPVAIARRFKDPGLRVMVDVDLLCRQRDLATLAEAALALGFRAVGENATYHLSFRHPDLGAGLELHFDLYEVLARRAEFVSEVFDRCEELEIDGLAFRAPSPAADLVLQLAHVLHHDQRVDLRHWLDFALAAEGLCGDSELDRLLRRTDLEPEYDECLAIARGLFGVDVGSGAREILASSTETPESFETLEAVEEALLDLEDRRPLLSGARMHPGFGARLGYVVRLLVPSPRRWRALAAAEGTGVGTALWRHVGRALGRGRGKLERLDRAALPGDSPRARLFGRRARHDT